ncbi:MAG TPA: tRNA pseudouridine(38-40) synthase TruA [Pirellulales bacterium]|nr:tRNA pseudouridine(38-40) synthase TruA [Pirellulales bacterium]
MRTVKLTLSYDGTAYAGWQSQANQPTLQDTFEAALAQVTGEAVRVVASGRTDAGVHALGQVVSFLSASALAPDAMRKALNAVLPEDMVVLAAVDAPTGFHATHDAVRKRYRYAIHDGPARDVFRRRYAWHVRRRLDAEAMHRAAQALAGTHDFRSFESAWPQRTSSVRTIFEIGLARGVGATEEDFVVLEVEADGFLYNMVRAIVGTLVEVGRGVRGETWPGEVLAALDRRAAGITAPPEGLCLVRVEYGDPHSVSPSGPSG